jgi:glycosyltransferase involved in cell wall biosynthesis
LLRNATAQAGDGDGEQKSLEVCMRIAQVAPLAESVPPRLYGGTERVVSWLTEELLALGHAVTLFASAESVTGAELVPVWPRGTRLSEPPPDPLLVYAALLDALASAARRFDVIHCHVEWIHLPLLRCLGVPFLTTVHGRLDRPGVVEMARRFPDAKFVSVSDSQQGMLPDIDWLGTVHHGLPREMLRPSAGAEHYLVFLGRISFEKGPHIAIRLAQAAGVPLRIAAKVPTEGQDYFAREVRPLIDGAQIQFLGEVDERSKAALLRDAAALLFPIDWPEPFGLVMIEAMACGTPTIAFRRGAVPEIVEDGATGFVAENEAEALRAIGRLNELDRRAVRAGFERRFTARRMAETTSGFTRRCCRSRRHRPLS